MTPRFPPTATTPLVSTITSLPLQRTCAVSGGASSKIRNSLDTTIHSLGQQLGGVLWIIIPPNNSEMVQIVEKR